MLFPLGAAAQATGKLNDTGILTCANATSNSVPCGYADNDTYGYPRQDTEYGRSAKDNAGQSLGKTGGSDANSKGFDFTKLRYDNGAALTAGAAFGTGANWGCTKDNVTGLIWLLPSPSGDDFRLNTNTYRWYSTDGTRNGGKQGDNRADSPSTCFTSTGTASTACNTKAQVDYANTLAICGEGTKNDWRLPTRLELLTIIDLSKQGSGAAAVDATYFPNMMLGNYWTQDTVAGSTDQARIVNFNSGGDGSATKVPSDVAFPPSKNYVILVRPSP